jgi:16S rRNA (guanine966-N2)-methyltransferase
MKTAQRLRIIGGQWRGRRVSFPDLPDLRPTGDRIRETVFNWLQMILPGARCLDLFAGSGALGLEAASRGAARVVLVERSARVCEALRLNREALGAQSVEIICSDALHYLQRPGEVFDVVFLDPPFDSDMIGTCCRRLEDGGWLAPSARIYLELAATAPPPELPGNWELNRSRKAGQVAFYLAQRAAAPTGGET